jgi:soluble lytic murein transglycosylase
VRAAHLLRAAGDAVNARLFAVRAGWNGGWSAAQHGYLAKFALDLTAPDYQVQTEVRMAKIAARDGIAVTSYGFPTLDLPEASSIEPALVYAVIRQESEFLVHVKSHAGAQGLMQLMPATARNEAKDIHLPYAQIRLTSDPGYNLRLGTQHLARLRDYYQGSYPLMIAAYNAGVGRVDRWLAAHGDPRTGKVEWADWIELIPFEETRLYTKYVLENHAVYRVTLGDTLEVQQLARYWQAPPSDPVYCNSEWAKLYTEVPDVIPVSAPPPAPAKGKSRAKAPKTHLASKKSLDIPLVRKEKPDNRAGIPSC